MCALSRSNFALYALYVAPVLAIACQSLALPIIPPNILQDVARRGAVIENLGGSIIVVNSATEGLITQGAASDGAGTDYDAAALIWLIGSFALGVPLAFAGVRGWRLTLGSATGLVTGLFGMWRSTQSRCP